MRQLLLSIALGVGSSLMGQAAPPAHQAEAIFPPEEKHNHGSCIVETPRGDLLVCWYNGSGERKADDVRVLGARKPRGSSVWSKPFLLADSPGFPDTNPCMLVDSKGKLWLFWQIILANEWHTALTSYKVSSDYESEGPPRWELERPLLLKPEESFADMLEKGIKDLGLESPAAPPELAAWLKDARERASSKLWRRLGWMTRPHPIEIAGGRLLVPLYSDGFDVSLMAWSDDDGATWSVSDPLVGAGNVQPSVVQRRDGVLAAYMRDNGPPPKRILYSQSADRGKSWSKVVDLDIPNPGAGLEVIAMRDGSWVLVNNDTERGRHSLAVWLSDDEGKTWKWKRHLEPGPDFDGDKSASYPSIVEGKDGSLHVSYSRSTRGETIFHAHFNKAWIQQGD